MTEAVLSEDKAEVKPAASSVWTRTHSLEIKGETGRSVCSSEMLDSRDFRLKVKGPCANGSSASFAVRGRNYGAAKNVTNDQQKRSLDSQQSSGPFSDSQQQVIIIKPPGIQLRKINNYSNNGDIFNKNSQQPLSELQVSANYDHLRGQKAPTLQQNSTSVNQPLIKIQSLRGIQLLEHNKNISEGLVLSSIGPEDQQNIEFQLLGVTQAACQKETGLLRKASKARQLKKTMWRTANQTNNDKNSFQYANAVATNQDIMLNYPDSQNAPQMEVFRVENGAIVPLVSSERIQQLIGPEIQLAQPASKKCLHSQFQRRQTLLGSRTMYQRQQSARQYTGQDQRKGLRNSANCRTRSSSKNIRHSWNYQNQQSQRVIENNQCLGVSPKNFSPLKADLVDTIRLGKNASLSQTSSAANKRAMLSRHQMNNNYSTGPFEIQVRGTKSKTIAVNATMIDQEQQDKEDYSPDSFSKINKRDALISPGIDNLLDSKYQDRGERISRSSSAREMSQTHLLNQRSTQLHQISQDTTPKILTQSTSNRPVVQSQQLQLHPQRPCQQLQLYQIGDPIHIHQNSEPSSPVSQYKHQAILPKQMQASPAISNAQIQQVNSLQADQINQQQDQAFNKNTESTVISVFHEDQAQIDNITFPKKKSGTEAITQQRVQDSSCQLGSDYTEPRHMNTIPNSAQQSICLLGGLQARSQRNKPSGTTITAGDRSRQGQIELKPLMIPLSVLQVTVKRSNRPKQQTSISPIDKNKRKV